MVAGYEKDEFGNIMNECPKNIWQITTKPKVLLVFYELWIFPQGYWSAEVSWSYEAVHIVRRKEVIMHEL
jgi:hypothetical protein